MTTKLMSISIKQALAGSAVEDSMPAGWLQSFFNYAKRSIPESEWNTAKVRGAAGISIEYEHALTREEEADELIDKLSKKANEIKALLPRRGEPLSAEMVDRIRSIVGG